MKPLRLLLIGLLLGLGVPLALPARHVEAHAAVVSARPRPGEALATAPGVVVLQFTEPINARLSRATVTDPSGRRFEGTAGGEQEIQVTLAADVPGIYEVAWTTVSLVDGHTLRGTFQFGVRATPDEATAGETALAPGPGDLLLTGARAAEYAALLLAAGVLLLRRLAARSPPLAWVGTGAGCVYVPALLAFVSGLAVVLGEALVAAPAPSIRAVADYLATGLPGAARLLRLGAEALAVSISLLQPGLAAAPLAAAAVALAAAGHAAAVRPAWWGIAVDALHLLTAGLWAGGILALPTVRPPGGWRGQQARVLLARFSPVALPAFLATVATGALRGTQELSALGDLLTSAYGRVLGLKALAVLAMVPLSLLAWRRRRALPRLEAAVAALVIGAAALLAAFPLPPARVGEAEEAKERAVSPAQGPAPADDVARPIAATSAATPALPQAGDLTLGGDAGDVLVGLTVRPGRPGRNEVLLFLLPTDRDDAAAPVPAELSAQGRTLPLRPCGPSCRRAEADLQGGERLEVRVGTRKGGTALFELPHLPAPDGSGLLEQVRARMQALHTFRLDEALGPTNPPDETVYAFQAPDRMQYWVSNGYQAVWVGNTQYERETPEGPWKTTTYTVATMQVPRYVWEPPGGRYVAPRILGTSRVEGAETQVLAFLVQTRQIPIWFRLWVDGEGLVRRAQMRAEGHFMEHRYYDFDAPFTIEPPVG